MNDNVKTEHEKPTVVDTSGLPDLLNAVIVKVFDNQESFLAKFFPEMDPEKHSVGLFYMASSSCFLRIEDWRYSNGYADYKVPTDRVLEWYEGI